MFDIFSSWGFALAKPWLHAQDPEQAHRAGINLLKMTPLKAGATPQFPLLRSRLFGLDFPNPLGLAAGFDKDGEVPDQMLGLGLGFVELGTVTPRPQSGNAKPRLFRLVEDRAVINRMGFNNEGHGALRHRLEARHQRQGLIGINIGANRDASDRIADYVAGVLAFGDLAHYITINISSPNTVGLRDLQSSSALQKLLDAVGEARDKLKRAVPLLVKLAPDLSDAQLADTLRICTADRIDGLILTNTTVARPRLGSPHRDEAGGLSGAPLFGPATRLLAQAYVQTEGRLPLIGVGGISSAEQAWTKLEAGASLLQLYSALIYQGPALITAILKGLAERLRAENLASLETVIGRAAPTIAHQKLSGT